MKDLIVLIASIILGLFIFTAIAGNSEDSIYSSVSKLWQQEAELKTFSEY